MAERKKQSKNKAKKMPPARTPEGRENQLIGLAVDLAEKKLRDGTAPTQVIVHYLKLATEKERLENDLLSKKTQLVGAQIDSLEASRHIEELYANAIAAMQIYSGRGTPDDSDL